MGPEFPKDGIEDEVESLPSFDVYFKQDFRLILKNLFQIVFLIFHSDIRCDANYTKRIFSEKFIKIPQTIGLVIGNYIKV